MSSITIGPRGLAPAQAAPGATTARPVDRPRARLRDRIPESARLLAATIAFYACMIAFPFLALAPVVLTGLFLGVFTTLFGGTIGR